MKTRVSWLITIGSHWEEHIPIPVGGYLTTREYEVEAECASKSAYEIARKLLSDEMKDESYHIWYWYFYPVEGSVN